MYQILSQLNQPNAAKFELERAAHTTPSDPEPFVILGNLALSERRVAEATADYEKAQALLASYPNAARKKIIETQTLSGIAQVAEVWEDWIGAEARLRKFLQLAPDDLLAHQRLARSLFWQTKVQDAYTVLKEGKQIDRENAKKPGVREQFLTPEAIMAQFYEQYETSGSTTGNAELWYNGALKNAKDDLATRLEVAKWALGKKGKLNMVKDQAEAALRIEAADNALPPDQRKYAGSTVGRMLRGLVALWEKDWPEAEKYFEKIILESPNDFGARNNIALALVEQNDLTKKKRALDYAEANYRDNKNNADALSTLGWVYFRRNEFDQAGLALDQAIKAAGGNLTNADTITYVAHILYHRDRKWETKALLEEILKSDRPFSMRPEAEKLYENVRDARKPDAPK
jgi:tetratricopeptide (TPR) repeat protein